MSAKLVRKQNKLFFQKDNKTMTIKFFFRDNNSGFSSNVYKIQEYLEEHTRHDLFEEVRIEVDFDKEKIICSSIYGIEDDNLILTSSDVDKVLKAALTIIGYATVVDQHGDVDVLELERDLWEGR